MRMTKLRGFDMAAFVLVLIAAFAMLRPGSLLNPFTSHPMILWSLELLACLVVLAGALVLRARMTAYCIAGVVAFMASVMAVRAYYWVALPRTFAPVITFSGSRQFIFWGRAPEIRGINTYVLDHITVLGAALLGVAFGAVLAVWGPKLSGRIRRAAPGGQGPDLIS